MKKGIIALIISASVGGVAYASSKFVAVIGNEEGQYKEPEPPHVVGTEYGEWSEFEMVGSPKDCDTYNDKNDNPYPRYDYISHVGSIYKLSLECNQDYTQKRDVFNLMSDGELIKTGEETNNKTEIVETIVIKDAMKEDVYVSERRQSHRTATYIRFSQDLSQPTWYYGDVYVNGDRIVRQFTESGRQDMINRLASFGYVLGTEIESRSFGLRMNNAPSINVWKVISKQDLPGGQKDCGSTPVDDYWNYQGNQCPTSGATKTVCTNINSQTNNGVWQRVSLRCEKW